MKTSSILLLILVLFGCTTAINNNNTATTKSDTLLNEENTKEVFEEKKPDIIGYWRNDTEKTDYNFYDQEKLLVLRKDSSMECTYTIEESNLKILKLWFKCPQIDWAGYAEYHEFIFTNGQKSFLDTMFIQGIAQRIGGQFERIQ